MYPFNRARTTGLISPILLIFCSHPTSCCSVAEIMSVLFFHSMKYRPEDPRNPNNDRFILSKVQLVYPSGCRLPLVDLVKLKTSIHFFLLYIILLYNYTFHYSVSDSLMKYLYNCILFSFLGGYATERC